MKKIWFILAIISISILYAQQPGEQEPNPNPNPTGWTQQEWSCSKVCREWVVDGVVFRIWASGDSKRCDAGTSSTCTLQLCDANCPTFPTF